MQAAVAPPVARFALGSAKNLVWLVPVLLLGWPAFAAGDPQLVAYCLIVVLASGVGAVVVDPISIENRRGEDRISEALLSVFLLSAVVFASADVGRLHWSDGVPAALRWTAVAALSLGYLLRIRAVWVNAFFSGVLVVQHERGHSVVDRGPYALIRHPGYASLLLILPSVGLALGSYLALVPLASSMIVVLRRTILEDRFLHRNLDGYRAYAARTRYRLIPGIY